MPEYLAPGVYVEEVSFRSKSIEGVPTSTTGFAGVTRFGPVYYPGGPSSGEPRLVTSFTEFERIYGGLEPVLTDRLPYVAHAARAFFANGGKRLYVMRVFSPRQPTPTTLDWGVASLSRTVATAPSTVNAVWRARWPGAMGNVLIEGRATRTKNVAFEYVGDPVRSAWGVQARLVKDGAVVEILPPPPPPPSPPLPANNDPLDLATLAVISIDEAGRQTFLRGGAPVTVAPGSIIQLVEMRVIVTVGNERTDVYEGLAAHPNQKRDIVRILQKDDPEDENATVWLDFDRGNIPANPDYPCLLVKTLQGTYRLDHGHDGVMPAPNDLLGKPADVDHPELKATGLEALADVDDIAIVALPDGGTYDDPINVQVAADNLIQHATNCRYRIAVVDGPQGSSMNEIRRFRGRFDSKYAALYHPWVEILDPLERPSQGAPPRRLVLPPSGFVAGIYARSDIERGVHKAPANEVVMGLTRFESNINKPRQDVLNPEGINALRFFEGRGNRVWGARTLSSDPEWKYVNVRRLFIYIEHSIDKASQWAVFEPNNDRLWANMRRMVEDFLLVLWRDGALLGQKPEDAYFVSCDRTTMTQNDLDNGRLVVLIGLAPTKPAEYVIFRIGQWTADAKRN